MKTPVSNQRGPNRVASREPRQEVPMKTVRRILIVVVILVSAFGVAAQALPAPQAADPPGGQPAVHPDLQFQDGAIEVNGLTPEGEVVLFGVARRLLGYHQRIERVEQTNIADATGYARFEIEDGLPELAVWAAIDLTTGEIAAGPSPGFPRGVRTFPTAGLRGGGGLPDRLGQSLEDAQILYVRPGEGAWGTALLDGGLYDLDGPGNGSFEVALRDFIPVNTLSPSGPPEEIAAGDRIVVVDSTNLTLFTLRVTPDALH